MAFIESHQELARHPKTRKLARALHVSTPCVIGHLHLLWWWCLDYADHGDLSHYDHADLADAMMWEGNPDELITEMVRARFLDQDADGHLQVHDFWEYVGRLIEKREANKLRMREKRSKPTQENSDFPPPDDTTTSTRATHVQRTTSARTGATQHNTTVTVHNSNTTSSSGDIDIKPRENAPHAHASVRPPSRKTKKEPPKERPRNEIWDAVAQAIGYEPKTRTEQSNWGKVCAELKEAGATPEEVSVRVGRYIRRYGRERLTVNALLTHWGECEIDVPLASNGRGGGLSDAEAQRVATQEREAAIERKEAERKRLYDAAMLYASND